MIRLLRTISDRAILDRQLSVAENTAAKVYMIPGNHDWENGERDGYECHHPATTLCRFF